MNAFRRLQTDLVQIWYDDKYYQRLQVTLTLIQVYRVAESKIFCTNHPTKFSNHLEGLIFSGLPV